MQYYSLPLLYMFRKEKYFGRDKSSKSSHLFYSIKNELHVLYVLFCLLYHDTVNSCHFFGYIGSIFLFLCFYVSAPDLSAPN